MYKLCKTEQSSRRQREIEFALLSEMVSRDFEDISVSDLCEKINLPRKAFYRYFDSKDGALHALIDHSLMDFEEFNVQYQRAREEKKSPRTLRNELERYFVFWTRPDKKALLDGLERSNLTGLLMQASIDYSTSSFINPKKFLPDESEWMRGELFHFAICGLMSIMLGWYRGGFTESTGEMAAAAARMLSRPLFPGLSTLGIE